MLKFSKQATPNTIATIKGGPWNNRFVDLITEIDDEDEETELFNGLNCPIQSEFIPFPCQKEDQRDVIYVTGASGTGKSTFAATYGDLFSRVFSLKDHPAKIVIVSPDDPNEDKAFSKADFDWVWISPTDIMEKNITLEDMDDPEFRHKYTTRKGETKTQPMLIIFDDVEALSDKKESKALTSFMQAVLERARKKQIFAVYISHRASAGLATKIILQEQNAIWFPLNGSGSRNLSYTLKYHLGIPDELRLALGKSPAEFGRWIYIKTDSCPRYAITSKKMFIINEDEIKAACK